MVNQRKRDIVTRLCQSFTDYKQCVVVALDNVSTNQIHMARNLLRKGEHKGEMIVGKNTLIRKALKFKTQEPNPSSEDYEDHKKWTQDPKLSALEPLLRLNIGLVFSDEPYTELKTKIEAEVVKQPVRTGVIAPCNVTIPAGPTGLETGLIDIFHKLNIQCKTVKSAIEVVKDCKIITKGDKVSEGATRLCSMLSIIPFEYALNFVAVYLDGVILDSEILDMKDDVILDGFKEFSGYLTALSLGANIPNSLSVPHFIGNSFKQLLAIGEESGYSFKQLEELKLAGANAPVQTQAAETKAEVKEEAKEEEVEEESEDMDVGDLFG